jgi:hypothetical protein
MLGQTGQVNPGELEEIGSSLLSAMLGQASPHSRVGWNPFLGFPCIIFLVPFLSRGLRRGVSRIKYYTKSFHDLEGLQPSYVLPRYFWSWFRPPLLPVQRDQGTQGIVHVHRLHFHRTSIIQISLVSSPHHSSVQPFPCPSCLIDLRLIVLPRPLSLVFS